MKRIQAYGIDPHQMLEAMKTNGAVRFYAGTHSVPSDATLAGMAVDPIQGALILHIHSKTCREESPFSEMVPIGFSVQVSKSFVDDNWKWESPE
jgi:hypothetical protein